ncbi:unnamed protein product, partial [Prorocentrum cordatum]
VQRAAFKQARKLRQSASMHDKFEKSGQVDIEGFVTTSRKHNDVKRKDNYEESVALLDACTDELGNKLQEVEVGGDKALRVTRPNSGGSEPRRGREIGEVHTGALSKGVVADDTTDEEGEEEGEEGGSFGDDPEGQDDEGEDSDEVGNKGGDDS